MAALYEQFLLFGDSITQASSPADGFGFAAPLQQAYARKLDVVNRGFNGYNTDKALTVLPRFMPSPGQAKTVFFGANDACVEGSSSKQHVCLEQYMENLRTICTHPLVRAHGPRLVIITPPPVNEYKMEVVDIAKGHDGLQRTAEHTKKYANAARKVGEELKIPVLDLWTIFMTRAGWAAGEPLPGCRGVDRNALIEELMYDGLHLTPQAYKIVIEELLSLIASAYPDQTPEKLPSVLPAWNDGDAWGRL
ncbi:putative gdsl lipase acylhydrolase family protein [Botryosphaeria dothidea]|uniref:Gdsl lipase acylhydrolase family protein n=1 Tax=Botryosphaeria dothidea TaxID=55169 RepID=A0A8H4JB52_9PEZI|nr:putative gdsl lipase acylhydrolase family protein [Botryosphaeria dothidea]